MHKKNEAVLLLNAILFSDIYLHTEDNDTVWDLILNKCKEIQKDKSKYYIGKPCIPKGTPFILGDSPNMPSGLPDIIYEDDTFVLGIEHFQFDASGISKKGSKMMRAEVTANNKTTEISENSSKRPLYIEVPVDTVFSYERYLKSLITSFTAHARNISKYLSELSKKYPNKKIYLAFYIEDKTALGNYIKTDRGIEPMCPLCINEFINELKINNNLTYILVRIQDNYHYNLHIQCINEEFIESLYKEAYDMKKDQYCTYNYKIASNIYSLSD